MSVLYAGKDPGTGWRTSHGTGVKYYQIEPGSMEWRNWIDWLNKNGAGTLARSIVISRRGFVPGSDPKTSGEAFLQAMNHPLPSSPPRG